MTLQIFRDPFFPEIFDEPSLGRSMHQIFHDMDRMHRHMQHRVGDNWLNENFRMDNPIVTDKDGQRHFKVHFDVHQYSPEEIKIATKDRCLTVEAKHEEKTDDREVLYQYKRSYSIPEGVKLDTMESKLSNTGILHITAPISSVPERKEHVIAIDHQ